MFAATGLPLFLPFGLPVLFAAAWGFVRAGPGRAAIVGRGRVC